MNVARRFFFVFFHLFRKRTFDDNSTWCKFLATLHGESSSSIAAYLHLLWHWNGLLCADVPLRNCSLTHSAFGSCFMGQILFHPPDSIHFYFHTYCAPVRNSCKNTGDGKALLLFCQLSHANTRDHRHNSRINVVLVKNTSRPWNSESSAHTHTHPFNGPLRVRVVLKVNMCMVATSLKRSLEAASFRSLQLCVGHKKRKVCILSWKS